MLHVWNSYQAIFSLECGHHLGPSIHIHHETQMTQVLIDYQAFQVGETAPIFHPHRWLPFSTSTSLTAFRQSHERRW